MENKKRYESINGLRAIAAIGIILITVLTATGISEWITFVNMNKNYVTVDTQSKLTSWIKENTDPQDVFLTPMWSTNRFYLAGRASFFGWPYYAWSAGHDTEGRSKLYFYLLRACNDNIDEFIEICKKEKIKYFIDTDEYYDFEDVEEDGYHKEYLTSHLKLVGDFPDEGTRIYEIY